MNTKEKTTLSECDPGFLVLVNEQCSGERKGTRVDAFVGLCRLLLAGS